MLIYDASRTIKLYIFLTFSLLIWYPKTLKFDNEENSGANWKLFISMNIAQGALHKALFSNIINIPVEGIIAQSNIKENTFSLISSFILIPEFAQPLAHRTNSILVPSFITFIGRSARRQQLFVVILVFMAINRIKQFQRRGDYR